MPDAMTPPDLIGAGVAPATQTSPESLIAQLRTGGLPQGGMPQDLAGLASMPQMQPGQAYASALAGGVAQMQGRPNPVMQQQAQQFHQAQQMQRMQQRVMEQRMRREESVLKLSQDLLNSENEDARMVGARGVLNFLGPQKKDTEALVKSLATRRLTTKDMGDIMQEMALGVGDPEIIQRWGDRLDPSTLTQLRGNLQKDDTRRILRLPTLDEEKAAILKRQREEKMAELDEVKLWRGKNPEISDAMLPYVSAYAQSKGIPLMELDPKNAIHAQLKAEAIQYAQDQIMKADPRRAQLEETARHHRVVEGQQAEGLKIRGQELELRRSQGPLGDKPLSGEAASQIIGASRLKSSTDAIDAIVKDPKKKKLVEAYIGPYASMKTTAMTATPMGLAGKVPTEVVDLEQNVASLYNYTVKLLTGAAYSEKEATRIAKELFNTSLPPDQFWRRYENGKRVIKQMREIVDAALIKGDRRALSAMLQAEGLESQPEAAAPSTPQSPLAAPTRVRVRSKSNPKKTGWATLKPGEALPDDLEEVK